MEFNQVESFVAVVQNKSFSKAAEVLYVSQPTVTSNVQKLESNLGLSLINRKTKNIALTKGGEIFYRYAIELINVCAKAEQSLNGYKDKMEGTLDVYASTIPEQYIVPYIIRDFRKEFPSVRHTGNVIPIDKTLKDTIDDYEKKYIAELIKFSKGNVSKAAEIADIARQNMHLKLKQYEINASDFRKRN